MELEGLLKKHFGYETFKTGQKEIIESVLSGKHTMAMLPTGTGKSLCYQLPAYVLKGQAIIVSPLLSLMQDQVEQMMMRGEKRVVAINSFLTLEEKREIFSQLHIYKYIFISPEMLSFDYVIERLQLINISLFVIDEAHCISQWGFDFRPDYMKLGKIRKKLGNPLTLALTATATREVMEDIVQSLELQEWAEISYSVDRPNIALKVEVLNDAREKGEKLIDLVSTLQGPGIIYFSSKKMTEEAAKILKENGNPRVMAYHAGIDQEKRILIQQQFINGQLDIICATSAFGMGINKENVRYVIHYHMPSQLEAYLQEIGRAGRDGNESIAILLYSPGDEQLPFQLAEGELPSESQVDWIVHLLQGMENPLENVDDSEEFIRIQAGLTDTQWRLIRDFLKSFEGDSKNFFKRIEEFKRHIQSRDSIKKRKIYEMKNWVHSPGCRREKVLQYFGEQKKSLVKNCCDLCGIEMDIFKKVASPTHGGSGPFGWKQHLSTILLNKRDEYEK